MNDTLEQTVKHWTSCNSYGDAESLHEFIQKHGKPYFDSRIDEECGWEVWIWRVHDTSDRTVTEETFKNSDADTKP